ncbi:MAG: hypothetical protein JNM44_06065 [Chitinophagaceae bacterium]|nr:hypothetical protein [Chitinophagaceae bacterium]
MKIRLLILFIVLILLNLSSLAQDTKDYTNYHHQITKIESDLSRGAFENAMAAYHQLGQRFNRMLARDAFNACQIAAFQKSPQFHWFVYHSANAGILLSTLLENRLIREGFLNDTITFLQTYSSGYKRYSKRIHPDLREEMLRRYELEQKNKGRENYLQICTDNFNRILELAKNGQFPGEELIGVNADIESIVIPTLCHFPYSYVLLQPYLNKALQDGNLNLRSIFYLYSFNQARQSMLYTPQISIDTVHFTEIYNLPFGFQSEDTALVNRNRIRHGLLPLDAQKRLKSITAGYGIDYLMGYN